MTTLNQLIKHQRKQKDYRAKTKALLSSPQKKGICIKVTTMTPRKPNSAIRKIARIRLSNGIPITAYIPGEGHNLQTHSSVLVRGGNTKDLPGLRYKVIRGKYDTQAVKNRKNGRSLYGTKKQ